MLDNDQTRKHYSGARAVYISQYTPSLLVSIPRRNQRVALGLTDTSLPFHGVDTWHGFEFTWLTARGKPEVAVAQIKVPAESTHIIESKSLKLYLGSFANTCFDDKHEVIGTLESDLTKTTGASVSIALMSADQSRIKGLHLPRGQSLDTLDIAINVYTLNPGLLKLESETRVQASLYTHLFRSICPITAQPDFATVSIHYCGKHICQAGLLKYLISYREHAGFGEQIIERIFIDLMDLCEPHRLDIQAHFTRRGGIDINPCRSLEKRSTADIRMWRQ